MKRLLMWLFGRIQCGAKLDVLRGGTFTCTRNLGHPGWHRCNNIKWE